MQQDKLIINVILCVLILVILLYVVDSPFITIYLGFILLTIIGIFVFGAIRCNAKETGLIEKDYQKLLANISSTLFMNEYKEEKKAINDVLKEVGQFFRADRIYIFTLDNEEQTMSNIYEWCASGVKPQIDLLKNVPLEDMSWLVDEMGKKDYILISDIEDLPISAATEKKEFKRQSIKSLLSVPLRTKKGDIGFIGLDAVKSLRKWEEKDIPLLKSIGEIIAISMERFKAEQGLRESEEKYRTLFNGISDGFALHEIILDDEGKPSDFELVEANSTFKKMFGIEEASGNKISRVYPKNPDIDWVKAFEKVATGGYSFLLFEWFFDSQNRWYSVRAYRPREGFVACMFQDITENILFEQKLRESEEKHRHVAEAANAVLWEYDIQRDRWTYVAPQVERILGYAPSEWKDLKFWVDHIHPDDREWAYNYCMESINWGEDHVFEYRFLKKNGEIAWLRDEVAVVMKGSKPTILRGLMVDITERKKAELALAENENKLRTLVSNIPGVVCRCRYDSDRTMEYISYDIEELTGYPASDFLNNSARSFASIIHPEEKKAIEEVIDDSVSNNVPYLIRYRIIHKNGDIIWVRENGRPLFDDNGKVQCLDSVIMNITERRKMQIELQAREEEYRTLVDSIPDIVARYDSQLRHIYVNKNIGKELGLPGEAFIGKTNREIGMQEENLRIWERGLRSAFTSKRKTTVEFFNQTSNGKKYYQGVIAPETLDDGEVNTVVSITRDITELKDTQLNLEAEKQKLEITLESIGDGVISTDKQGKVVLMNSVAEELTGWTEEDARGHDFAEVFNIINEKTRKKCDNPVEKVLRWKRTVGLANHTILIARDGEERAIADSAAPIKSSEGIIEGVIIVFRDVSKERKKQREIEYLSFHDKLTGLYNRAFFDKELNRLDTKRQLPVTIIMGDMNGLKLINDSLGHEKGDKLLKLIAQILRQACRKEDIIARWGGDEFVLLMPKTGSDAANRICDRIKNECNRKAIDNINPSISLGWAVKEKIEEEIRDVLIEAENHMYKRKLTESSSARNSLLRSLEDTLHERSHETREHSKRLRILSLKLGQKLGLSGNELSDIEILTKLHDIGKVGVPDNVLLKEDSLSEKEWETVKEHSEIGYRLMSASNDLRHLAEPILSLHERWDGTGYPNGLKGESIPYISRIVAVVDSYDVMVNGRPYKQCVSRKEALEEIKRCAGTQFDPEIAEVFINMMSKK